MNLLCPALLALSLAAQAAPPSFEMVELNANAGVVPAVALADIDGDGDLDVVAMSNDDIAWHENPGWQRHVITPRLKNLNVCMALADIDGDGLPEVAAGADWQFENTLSGGSLHLLARNGDPRAPWQRVDLLEEPSLHRIRWADSNGDSKPELYVAPLKGRGSSDPDFREAGVRLLRLAPPSSPLTEPWPVEVVTQDFHVMHNLIPFRAFNGRDALLTVSFEGIALVRQTDSDWDSRVISPGSPLPWPRSGASEIKTGALAEGVPALATIEPWHGNIVAVYTPDKPGPIEEAGSWRRHVLDESYNQGHAIAWADFDGDGRDELVAGYREPSPRNDRVGLYCYTFEAFAPDGELRFERHAVDDGGIATEDVAVGDLNGDGKPDILASGRSTHNIRIYLSR